MTHATTSPNRSARRRAGRRAAALLAGSALTLGFTSAAGASTPATTPASTPAAGSVTPVAGEFSLAAAVAAAPQAALADSIANMTMKFMMQGQPINVGMDMQYDAQQTRASLTATVDMSSMAQTMGTTPAGLNATLSIPMVMDLKTASLYVDTTLLQQFGVPLGGTKRFMRIDLNRLGDGNLQTQIAQITSGGIPAMPAFDESIATEAGRETIDGEELQRYDLNLDLSKANIDDTGIKARVPMAGGMEIPKSLPASVFVSRDNKIRLVQMKLDMGQMTADAEVRMPAVTTDVVVDLPDPDQVMDAPEDLYQSMGGSQGSTTSVTEATAVTMATAGGVTLDSTGVTTP